MGCVEQWIALQFLDVKNILPGHGRLVFEYVPVRCFCKFSNDSGIISILLHDAVICCIYLYVISFHSAFISPGNIYLARCHLCLDRGRIAYNVSYNMDFFTKLMLTKRQNHSLPTGKNLGPRRMRFPNNTVNHSKLAKILSTQLKSAYGILWNQTHA